MKKFAQVLDETLWKLRKTNLWLAEQTGLQPSTISRYRRGIGEPTLAHFMLLSEHLPELRAWYHSAFRKGPK